MTEEEAIKVVEDTLHQGGYYKKYDTVTLDSNIEGWGLDSLAVVEIAICIEDKFGVCFNDKELTKVKTVRDIIKLVEVVVPCRQTI